MGDGNCFLSETSWQNKSCQFFTNSPKMWFKLYLLVHELQKPRNQSCLVVLMLLESRVFPFVCSIQLTALHRAASYIQAYLTSEFSWKWGPCGEKNSHFNQCLRLLPSTTPLCANYLNELFLNFPLMSQYLPLHVH